MSLRNLTSEQLETVESMSYRSDGCSREALLLIEDLDTQLSALREQNQKLQEALQTMVRTYPYSPPCCGWEQQVAAHKQAEEALNPES